MPIDLSKFAKHLRERALPPYGKGWCARYVRQALQAAGAHIPQSYALAGKDFGPTLERLGFREIDVGNPDKFTFIVGNIMTMDPTMEGHVNGHVAGFDGKAWVSDHVQRDFWCGKKYREERPCYAVYRY